MEASLATVILYLYWISDILLTVYGLPTTLSWVNPPKILSELFHYGKCRDGKVQSSLVKFIEIPKSWFKHFYYYGFIISFYMLMVTSGCFMLGMDVPGRQTLVELIGKRRSVISEEAVIMVCGMMLIQHSRRIYECLFVSVYSKGTMNVLHYLLGVLLYSTVQICAICDGPKLAVRPQRQLNIDMDTILMNWNLLLGGVLFIVASYYHNQSHVLLANLRKDKSGQNVVHKRHVIPRGGLFEYLSAPHFVCEIVIYIAIGIVAWNSWTVWMGPVLFTATNQMLMAHETHRWYKKTFKSYPKNRGFLVPYLL